MKSERLISAGSGAGRTPKFIKDFSYSLNRRCNLLVISKMSSPRLPSVQLVLSQDPEFSALCYSVSSRDQHCYGEDPQQPSKIYHDLYEGFQSNSNHRREFFTVSRNPS
jgi:hypothetical protein